MSSSKQEFLAVKHGTTRTVILIGKYAIKIPQLKSWKGFLKGFLANMNEKAIHHLCPNYFLPVLWASRAGFVVIMPRVKINTAATWYLHAFMADLFHANNDNNTEALTARRYCEYIANNVAMYKGKPVCIDYGTYVHPDATESELDGEMYYLKLETKRLVEEIFGEQNWDKYGETLQPVEEPYQVCLELLDIPKFTTHVESRRSQLPHALLEVEKGNEGQVIRTAKPGDPPSDKPLGYHSSLPRRVSVSGRGVPNEAVKAPVVLDTPTYWNPGC